MVRHLAAVHFGTAAASGQVAPTEGAAGAEAVDAVIYMLLLHEQLLQ